MSKTSPEEDEVRQSRRLTAKIMRDLAEKKDVRIKFDGTPVTVNIWMADPQVVAALLKIGLFSVGAQSFSDMKMETFGGRSSGSPMSAVPVAMISLAFNYALRVGGLEKTQILRHARRIERAFGPVSIDPLLMSEIAAMMNVKEV